MNVPMVDSASACTFAPLHLCTFAPLQLAIDKNLQHLAPEQLRHVAQGLMANPVRRGGKQALTLRRQSDLTPLDRQRPRPSTTD